MQHRRVDERHGASFGRKDLCARCRANEHDDRTVATHFDYELLNRCGIGGGPRRVHLHRQDARVRILMGLRPRDAR